MPLSGALTTNKPGILDNVEIPSDADHSPANYSLIRVKRTAKNINFNGSNKTFVPSRRILGIITNGV